MTADETLDDIDLDGLVVAGHRLTDRRDGKVRVSWALGSDHRLFITTDRLSAFDRVIARVPCKGQVLNQLAAWWFNRTTHIVANHARSTPDPNVLIARAAIPLPVEVIVRGAITGVTDTSLWTRYAAGDRVIDGHRLPDGLTKNTLLPNPIITPTTKAAAGGHDVPLSCAEVTASGLVEPALWDQIQSAAIALFAHGAARGREVGLILADTKFEFGVTADGTLLLIDEALTPDSSRWWIADGYEARLRAGQEPESLDKEVVRLALADAGYTGHGPIPELDSTVWSATSARYVRAFEQLTGTTFVRGDAPPESRIRARLARLEHL